MKKKQINKGKLIGNLFGFGLIAFIIGFIIWGLINDNRLEKGPSAYAIAIITKVRSGAKVPPWFNYHFTLDGKLYKNKYSIADKMSKYPWSELEEYIGKRFFVKFYIPDPSNNALQIYKPVPEHIKETPKGGWKKIPPSTASF